MRSTSDCASAGNVGLRGSLIEFAGLWLASSTLEQTGFWIPSPCQESARVALQCWCLLLTGARFAKKSIKLSNHSLGYKQIARHTVLVKRHGSSPCLCHLIVQFFSLRPEMIKAPEEGSDFLTMVLSPRPQAFWWFYLRRPRP